VAIGVLQEAATRGIKVPDDLSVVGFRRHRRLDVDAASADDVEQPIAEIAETAVNALQELIENPGRSLPNFVFRPVLRVRGSTAPPPA
jgi:DNA-binding LacI/PurR family transcriptional regulator